MSKEAAERETTGAGALSAEERDQIADVFGQRARTYAWIARLFEREVDQEFLDQLVDMRFPADSGDAQLDRGNRALCTYLSNVWSGTLTDLARDYTQCFLGNGIDGTSAVYPFESVYTSKKHLIMQASRDEVLAIYRAYGMEKSPEWRDSEDHIALELAFMSELSRRCAEKIASGDADVCGRLVQVQRSFLEEHLGAWLPDFAERLRTFAHTGFYRGAADIVEGFVRVDGDFLAECAEALDEDAQAVPAVAGR